MEGRRGEWEGLKPQGKAAYLWRVGMLRMALPYGAGMLIFFFLYFAPDSFDLPFSLYVGIVGAVVIVSVLGGLFTALTTLWGMKRSTADA